MDIIFEFLVELIVEVLACVVGELFGIFVVLIGIGVAVVAYWPFGATHNNALIGCAMVVTALVVGVLIGRRWLRKTNRPGQAQDALAPRAAHEQ